MKEQETITIFQSAVAASVTAMGMRFCSGIGYEMLQRNKLKIVRTLQLLYSDDCFDIDYTVFIFEDKTIRWMEGKERTQEFKNLDFVPVYRLIEFRDFETLPSCYTKEELLEWK